MPINGLELDMVSYVVHGTKFEAPRRYTVLEPVGQGAYGVVCAAQDEETQEACAIKKIENAFEHTTFAKRTLRELRILRHMQHENIIDVRMVYLPGETSGYEDIYVVTELMESDLASIVKSVQPISDDHCQFFLYQILRGLKYIHSAEVLHRDLKPRNLLVNSNCDLKICDYGLARQCGIASGEIVQCPMTEYVCTRWYRAPELLCAWNDYGKAIDMWSVGCIFAEMIRRKPIFPGTNTQHQLQIVIDCLGSPEREVLSRVPNDKCRNFMESLPITSGVPLDEVVATSPEALELLRGMLHFNPDSRISVEQALQFAYLGQLHCPDDEPSREPLDLSDFEFECRKIDMAALRQEIFLEALRYYPEKRQRFFEEQLNSGKMYSVVDYRLLAQGESQYTSDDDD